MNITQATRQRLIAATNIGNPVIMSKSTKLVCALAICLSGCAVTTTIQPAISSNSSFDGAVYSGESVTISATPQGVEEFRVFHQGATGFVSVQSVRSSAEQRATEFCDRNGKVMKPLRETSSKPPHIFGNFPRVELIFGCIDKA